MREQLALQRELGCVHRKTEGKSKDTSACCARETGWVSQKAMRALPLMAAFLLYCPNFRELVRNSKSGSQEVVLRFLASGLLQVNRSSLLFSARFYHTLMSRLTSMNNTV